MYLNELKKNHYHLEEASERIVLVPKENYPFLLLFPPLDFLLDKEENVESNKQKPGELKQLSLYIFNKKKLSKNIFKLLFYIRYSCKYSNILQPH